VGAWRDDAEDPFGDRLEIGAEMHRRFERQDRDPRRLDPDMAKHLLVRGLDAFRREHRRDAARLVGDECHRADVEAGTAIHRAGAGEDAAGEARDPPLRGDRHLAGISDLAADRLIEQRALASSSRRRGGFGIDDHPDHRPLGALRNESAQQADRVGGAAGARIVLDIGQHDRLSRITRQKERLADRLLGRVELSGKGGFALVDR